MVKLPALEILFKVSNNIVMNLSPPLQPRCTRLEFLDKKAAVRGIWLARHSLNKSSSTISDCVPSIICYDIPLAEGLTSHPWKMPNGVKITPNKLPDSIMWYTFSPLLGYQDENSRYRRGGKEALKQRCRYYCDKIFRSGAACLVKKVVYTSLRNFILPTR